MLLKTSRQSHGDLNARASTSKDRSLWQIGLALNNLLARFKNAARAEYSLQHITQDIAQLRIAVRYWQSGQQLQWRPSREVMLNPLIDDIRRALAAPTASNTATTGGMPPVHKPQPGQRSYAPETPLPQVNPFFAGVPETPRYNSLDNQPENQSQNWPKRKVHES